MNMSVGCRNGSEHNLMSRIKISDWAKVLAHSFTVRHYIAFMYIGNGDTTY